MNAVRTPCRTRRNPASPQVPREQRPFGLQDCPAFYLAKIVPPETSRMPFVTDTEVSENFFWLIRHTGSEGGEKGAHWTFFLEIQVHDTAAAS